MRQFEKMIAKALTDAYWHWRFEHETFKIKAKMPGQFCVHCGEPQYKITKYTPDFIAFNHAQFHYVIEVKGGSFKATDQARYKRFVMQHPDINYMIVFRSNVRLRNLKGKPTVREWGEKNGITVLVGIDELNVVLKGSE